MTEQLDTRLQSPFTCIMTGKVQIVINLGIY